MMARSTLHSSHKTLGLGLGLLLMLQAASGAALVFREELLIAMNRQLLTAPPPTVLPAIERIQQSIDDRVGDAVVERIVFPRGQRTAAMAYLQGGGLAGRRVVASDPATGVVLGEITGRGLLPFVLFRFHDELLLGVSGHALLLIEGGVLLYLVVAGVILARPAQQPTLRVRWRGTRLQRRFDLHRTVGLSLALFIAFSAITGAIMQADFLAAGAPSAPAPRTHPSWSALTPHLARLAQDYPAQAIEDIRFSADGSTAKILAYSRDAIRPLALDRVEVDLLTGEVLSVHRAADDAAGRNFLAWMYPLHTGKALGTTGAAIALVSALGVLCMPMLGFLLWRAKSRKRPARQH